MPVHIRNYEVLAWQYKGWVWELFSLDPLEDHQHVLRDSIWSRASAGKQIVKGSGGVIGLTENPDAFWRWMLSDQRRSDFLSSLRKNIFLMNKQSCLSSVSTMSRVSQHSRPSKYIYQLLRYHTTNGKSLLGWFLRSSNSRQSQLYRRVSDRGNAQLERHMQETVEPFHQEYAWCAQPLHPWPCEEEFSSALQ